MGGRNIRASVLWTASTLVFVGGIDTARSDEAAAEFVHFQASDVPYESDAESQRLGYVVLSGNPDEPGIYVVRLRIPPGMPLFRPHFHDQDRFITVISGTWAFGRGDSGKCEDTIPLDPGAYVFHPKGAVHFDGSCVDETVEVQIIGQGPVRTTWIDAAE
jgi:quercetin dioxygenase-like cupin family protein